jgi:folate-binding protein YgfZ
MSERDGSRWDAVRYRGGVATRPPESLDLYLPPGETPGFDIPAVSDEAWEVWRIEHGVPLYGVDISRESLPQETGLVVERVSFVKGCYTGQEVLARIHYRGKVNRHLRGLRGPAPLSAGDVVESGGKEVGAVTSAAHSPLLGWIGLATIRREVEPGDTVEIRGPERTDSVEARVTELPIPPG